MPGFEDGFGLVYAKTMGCGIAVIASPQDAGPDINVVAATGFNVSRVAPELMADSIIALLCDRDLAARMGRPG